MKDEAARKKTKLIQYLKGAVLTLRLEPGQDLDEAALSEAFGLSRTPLREVFLQLAGEGFIELRKNRGAWVSALSHTTLRDFFLAAPMVYGAILKLAARNARSEQINELQNEQDLFKEALRKGTVEDRALANNRFHEVTGDMAENIYLLPSFRRLLIDHARIGMTFYGPQDSAVAENLSQASDQHDAIIAAIKSREEDTAEQLAVDHWNLSREQIESFVTPRSLEMPLGGLARKTPA